MLKRIILIGTIFQTLCFYVLAFPAAAGQTGDTVKKVVLNLKLPKPMFIGTPRNIRTPNLERITGEQRKPFYVPEGTIDISRGKPVSSSDEEPVIGEIKMVTDGEKSGEEGYFVELGPGKQFVQIDLKGNFNLYALLVWHYHNQARVYRDLVVQVASEPDFISGVQTIFNNDHDNSSGLGVGKDKEYIETNEGRLIDPRGVKCRYIRLYSNGNTANDMNHYVEVEVYGSAAK